MKPLHPVLRANTGSLKAENLCLTGTTLVTVLLPKGTTFSANLPWFIVCIRWRQGLAPATLGRHLLDLGRVSFAQGTTRWLPWSAIGNLGVNNLPPDTVTDAKWRQWGA